MMRRAIGRPRPTPLLAGSWRVNGTNSAAGSAGRPGPVSSTCTAITPASGAIDTRTSPPCGVRRSALLTRFASAVVSMSGSPRTTTLASPSSVWSATPARAAMSACIAATSVRMSARSTSTASEARVASACANRSIAPTTPESRRSSASEVSAVATHSSGVRGRRRPISSSLHTAAIGVRSSCDASAENAASAS